MSTSDGVHCDGVPLWWDYLSLVDGHHDNMGKEWDAYGPKPPSKT